MWCCWISPDHNSVSNSVSIQRSARSGYRAPSLQSRGAVSIRLMARLPNNKDSKAAVAHLTFLGY
jgi:hypothetical protein